MREATCDTSVLVPALVTWHPAHEVARTAVESRVRKLPGHVFLECFSVLTRLPAPHRLSPGVVGEVLDGIGLELMGLEADAHREVVRALAEQRIGGGAVYDAAVAATARAHGLTLLTLDRRARTTYDVVGVAYEVLSA